MIIKEKYKVNRNVHIVTTGIDVEKFYNENFDLKEIIELRNHIGLKKEDFVLLYVGRIASEKNISFLLNCQKVLIKRISNLKLLIIGDGPDLDKHKKEVTGSSFKDSVIFLGKVPYAEVPKYYQLGDIFVTASKTETQGLTVIEAMASSMPVVCARDESFMNTVIPDLNGYMFNNKREYRNVIIDLYRNNDKLLRLKKQARLNGSMHSAKYYGERIVDVYKIAINNYNHKKNNFWDYVKKVVGINEKNNRSKPKDES